MTSWNRMIQERIIDSDLIDGFAVLTAYHTQCIYSYGELEVLSKVDPQKFQSLGRIFDKIDITDSVIKIPNIQSQYQVFYKSMSRYGINYIFEPIFKKSLE
ncbi:hypothetical protein G9A89_002279 [Geosiphon pyriformis]|nr:hypothetical protein G9A89_002279 [Geosiphon pyriformis]